MFGKDPQMTSLALMGFGNTLSALGRGQQPNNGAIVATMAQGRQRADRAKAMQESGVLDSFTPEQRAVLMSMEPGAAQQIIAQKMFAKPQGPNYQFIDGFGMVDMNNPPPEIMGGNYQPPQAPGYQTMTGAELGLSGELANQTFNVSPDGKVTPIGGSAPQRRIIKGADGLSYYEDTKELVLPNDEVPEPEPEKMTESERRIFMFGEIQNSTGPAINRIEEKGFDPSNARDKFASGTLAGNWVSSSEGQIYNALANSWVEGALRLSTGAAANAEEYPRIRNTYFAQVGDTPQTIAFKRQMRLAYEGVIKATLAGDPNAKPPSPLVYAVEQLYASEDDTGEPTKEEREEATRSIWGIFGND